MKNIIKMRTILCVLIILIGVTLTSVAYPQYVTNNTNDTNDTKINSTNISKKTVSINVQVDTGKGMVGIYRNNKSIGTVSDGDEVKTFAFEIWDKFKFEAVPDSGYNHTKFCPEGEGGCYTNNPFVGIIAGEGSLFVRFSNSSGEDINNSSGEDINNSSGEDINNSNIVTQTIVPADTGKRTEKSPAISFIVSVFVIIILVLIIKK